MPRPGPGAPPSIIRPWLCGALTPLAVATAIAAATARYWPDTGVLAVFGRMLDSLSPQLSVLGLAMAGLLALLGAPRLAALLTLVLGLGAATLVGQHLSLSQPPDPAAPTDLRVLWFNLLSENTEDPETIADALIDSPADIVILSEAAPIRSQMAELAAAFPYHQGCGPRTCEIVLLSRLPGTRAAFRPAGTGQPHRLLQAHVPLPDGRHLTLVAAHMIKPFFHGFSEPNEWILRNEIAALPGPLAVFGDFNAAPWSRRMTTGITASTPLSLLRWPPATWPVWLRPVGVPLDQVLTGPGTRVTAIAPWGMQLGSNHAGILAGLCLCEDPADQSPDQRDVPPR